MRPHRIGLTVIAALVAAVSTPLSLNFPVPLRTPAALAQSTEARKAEAERLFIQGSQQFKTSQFQAAIQSWQQALNIYREIGNRNGEANSLNNLGNAYNFLRQYAKAIEFYQLSLAIKREIGDRNGEAGSLTGLGNAYNDLGQYANAPLPLSDPIVQLECTSAYYSHLAPFSIRLEKPGFCTKNLGFQVKGSCKKPGFQYYSVKGICEPRNPVSFFT